MMINEQEKVDDVSVREAEKIYFASQWQLLWLKFRKHKLAIASCILLGIFYLLAVFMDGIGGSSAHRLVDDQDLGRRKK